MLWKAVWHSGGSPNPLRIISLGESAQISEKSELNILKPLTYQSAEDNLSSEAASRERSKGSLVRNYISDPPD
ncbi:hypothetical protein PCANC_06993 [Puccinia coronata f. sp. avenae]|uniref:Uncharacterized protein n=1 Tax=Puccinia coronata f. sp. avenae TaxID=200324 RepID=A0A2N5SUM1_9BASI|nr:hypothetical protein PCANC_18885 [Puccinia coronata f. sp. avenae]PLW16923.1 hypothetical protein PCASD_13334 [Puccinia coronata f. sp. avenae]PLW41618.1 hypothetical protein PCASD_05412 [Puccinia coronata f. sp. avenae]PLW43194.1 hypothetical protein PCANC_06993 [Puccinia coronata f. sp. avenae]